MSTHTKERFNYTLTYLENKIIPFQKGYIF